jgi:hypothetical protein
MKLANKDDKANTGRIHVDYANARNDQHEYECEQRAMAREMRHQQQIQEERLRVPSPPPAKPFTIYDGNALLDTIKSKLQAYCCQLRKVGIGHKCPYYPGVLISGLLINSCEKISVVVAPTCACMLDAWVHQTGHDATYILT